MPGLPEVRHSFYSSARVAMSEIVLWKGKTGEHLSWPAQQEVATAFVT